MPGQYPITKFKAIDTLMNMGQLLYSQQLKEQLINIEATAKELAKEDPTKSTEQFRAEIDFIVTLLKEARLMVD
jgi:hypothetical protein